MAYTITVNGTQHTMSGNLCRCATCTHIRAAIKQAAGLPTAETSGLPTAETGLPTAETREV